MGVNARRLQTFPWPGQAACAVPGFPNFSGTAGSGGEAGEENFFLFGLTAQQVVDSAGWYDPRWHYAHDRETREAVDLITSDLLTQHEAGVFDPIRHALLDNGDFYRHLADLTDYARAHHELDVRYADRATWHNGPWRPTS